MRSAEVAIKALEEFKMTCAGKSSQNPLLFLCTPQKLAIIMINLPNTSIR
jgi:hypothetical protein